jgi:hypothetical protein
MDDFPTITEMPKELLALEAMLGFEGKWAPLYVEPMIGSGERLTFAIAAFGNDGSSIVSRIVRSEVLRVLYGQKAKAFSEMLAAAEAQVAEVLEKKELTVAFATAGFELGEFREARGRNLQDLVDQGRMMCASLAAASAEIQQASDVEEDERQTGKWAAKVQAHVVKTAADLGAYFSRTWTPRGSKIPAKFGYYDGRYAAHFGVVRRDSPTGSLYHLKARLWELDSAKGDLAGDIRQKDLLLARPNLSSASISLTTRDRVRDVLEEVTMEADRHNIYVLHTEKADAAGRRLYAEARRVAA